MKSSLLLSFTVFLIKDRKNETKRERILSVPAIKRAQIKEICSIIRLNQREGTRACVWKNTEEKVCIEKRRTEERHAIW